MSTTHQGLLLIADITGYTGYLTASELEHAQGVLESLLAVLVDETKPPLKVSGFEGDAILSYTIPGAEVSSQTFIEILETCYIKFRRHIDLLVLNNSCGCNACANISALDLKFFVHWASFTLQQLGQGEELFGPDVILIHRLLKNGVREATGIVAYSLFTKAAADRLQLPTADLIPHQESYPEFGTVELFVQNLQPVWEEARQRRTGQLPQKIFMADEVEIALNPATVWDYLVAPQFRSILMGGFQIEATDRRHDGRLGEGSSFVCYHGDRTIQELILEWHPFEELVTRDLVMPGVTMISAATLSETDRGTRFRFTFGDVEGPALKALTLRMGLKAQAKKNRRDLENFRDAVEADYAQRMQAPAPSTS